MAKVNTWRNWHVRIFSYSLSIPLRIMVLTCGELTNYETSKYISIGAN